MFSMVLGLTLLYVGIQIFRHPDADLLRWFSQIPEEVVRSKEELLKERIGALLTIFLGIVMSLSGALSFFDASSLGLFIFSFILGLITVIFGIYAVRNPEWGWLQMLGLDTENDDLHRWFIRIIAKGVVIFGLLCMLLSAQFLFA
ncbi:hypothetical protein ACH6EH_10275 [Paenibacillus sp. JSM ZJ436]